MPCSPLASIMLPFFGRDLPSEIQGKKSWVSCIGHWNYSYRNWAAEEEEIMSISLRTFIRIQPPTILGSGWVPGMFPLQFSLRKIKNKEHCMFHFEEQQ